MPLKKQQGKQYGIELGSLLETQAALDQIRLAAKLGDQVAAILYY